MYHFFRGKISILFLLTTTCAVAGATDTLQKAITTKVTPFYSEPQSGLLPKGYLKKGETHAIREVTVDTVGIPWFGIILKTLLKEF